jgi:hypothetical protein
MRRIKMNWNRVGGGFGFVVGTALFAVGVMTANPVAVYYGGELAFLGGVGLLTGSTIETVGPSY